MRRAFAILSTLLLVSTAAAAAGAGNGYDPDQHQQEAISELNRARWDPQGWGQENGVDLSGVLPLPPLAVNGNLMSSASFKANEIEDLGYEVIAPDHWSPYPPPEGTYPDELAVRHGYDLPGLDHRVNTIEIYYAGAFDPVTAIAGSPAHRAMAFTWATREEIGVGLSDQNRNWVFHIANRDNTGPFVTGTVFDDVNGNGVMDAGEGLEGVRVKVSGSGSTYTDAGGGYSIETTPGVHRITASGAGFRGTSTAKFTATGYNAGAEFISGESRPVIRVYDLCNGLEPTILGTDGRDVIHGTPGDDVIFAGRGRDRIYGGGGDDVICGGGGRDRISAHAGNDIIFGGSGDDIINGNRHNDVIHGGSGTDLVNGRGGRDRLDGGADFDTIDGGPQKDRCRNGETLISCEM